MFLFIAASTAKELPCVLTSSELSDSSSHSMSENIIPSKLMRELAPEIATDSGNSASMFSFTSALLEAMKNLHPA
jgi:hypothetical protein